MAGKDLFEYKDNRTPDKRRYNRGGLATRDKASLGRRFIPTPIGFNTKEFGKIIVYTIDIRARGGGLLDSKYYIELYNLFI
jgi:hypothetical protein